MFYVVFEATPFEGKEKLGETYYISLLPHVHKNPGFRGDSFSGSPHTRSSVNIAVWDDENAAWGWRNEENHLRLQKKGSDGVYESYRIRLGYETNGNEIENADDSQTRHYLTLLYRTKVDGMPQDDVLTLIDNDVASQLKSQMIDSAVYQGAQTVWITTWRSEDAAAKLAASATHSPDDQVLRIRVKRDYTKSDRKDAPHETPGTI